LFSSKLFMISFILLRSASYRSTGTWRSYMVKDQKATYNCGLKKKWIDETRRGTESISCGGMFFKTCRKKAINERNSVQFTPCKFKIHRSYWCNCKLPDNWTTNGTVNHFCLSIPSVVTWYYSKLLTDEDL
jgi:hypothetical protein